MSDLDNNQNKPLVESGDARESYQKTHYELNAEELVYTSIGEALGMFFFVTTLTFGGGNVYGLYVVLVAFAPICGSHFNPNITLAHFICFPRESHSTRKLIFYFIGQICGASLAMIVTHLTTDKVLSPVVPASIDSYEAFFVEFLWGGWLTFINLYVCSTITSPSKHFLVNVAIFTCCLTFNISATAGLSGGSLNPTIGFFGNLWGIILNGNEGKRYSRSLWINSLGPLSGAIVFSFFFAYLFVPGYQKLRSINHSKTELCNENQIKGELR